MSYLLELSHMAFAVLLPIKKNLPAAKYFKNEIMLAIIELLKF